MSNRRRQRQPRTSDKTCHEQCRDLYDAYVALLSGSQRQEVQYQDQRVEFHQPTASDRDQLRQLYMSVYNACPDAQCDPGLPDLSKPHVDRGGPAHALGPL